MGCRHTIFLVAHTRRATSVSRRLGRCWVWIGGAEKFLLSRSRAGAAQAPVAADEAGSDQQVVFWVSAPQQLTWEEERRTQKKGHEWGHRLSVALLVEMNWLLSFMKCKQRDPRVTFEASPCFDFCLVLWNTAMRSSPNIQLEANT